MKPAYRLLVLLTAVWSTNVTIAGTFDIQIHCVSKRADQTVKKASDGGVNETRKQERLGLKADSSKRQQSGSFSIDLLKRHEKKSFSIRFDRAKQGEPCWQLDLFFRRETQRAGHTR